MNPTFDKWCEKLLDTGKANRLINYKESKMRTISIMTPEAKEIFDKISDGDTLSFYDIDGYIDRLKKRTDKDQIDEVLASLTRDKLLNDILRLLKPHEVLSYKKDTPLKKVLKNLKKLASTSLNEKGINILYIAFGQLHWREKEAPHEAFSSPLVLIPIRLENDANNRTYNITQYEDEYSVNPTLMYKFKSEYDITIPNFREGEYENENIEEYFSRLAKAVDKLEWTVTNEVCISTFSYLKLNMYKDLKENEDAVLKNTVVRNLLNIEAPKSIESDIDMDKYFSESQELNLQNVVDADSSQMSAIVQAKAGRSFVLQGPPGTGKSQTITNLIAEFLYEKKKILFVSEKLAALQVVYNNMRKAGLDDFCLELHSNKINKKDVIAELYRVLNSNKKTVNTQAKDEIKELRQAKDTLDKYAAVLHKIVPGVDKSTYDIINEICALDDAPTFDYYIDYIDTKDHDYLYEATSAIVDYMQHISLIGTDYRAHPWYGYIKSDTTYKDKLNIKKNIDESREYLLDLQLIANDITQNYGIDISTIHGINKHLELLMLITKLHFYDSNIFDVQSLDKLLKSVQEYNKTISTIADYKSEVAKVYSDSIYEIDLPKYYLRYRNDYMGILRILKSSYRHDSKVLRSYQIDTTKKLNYRQTLKLLDYARSVSVLSDKVNTQKSNIDSMLSDYNKKTTLDYVKIEKELVYLHSILKESIPTLQNISIEDFRNVQTYIKDFVNILDNNKSKLTTLSNLQQCFDSTVFDIQNTSFDSIISRFDNMYRDTDSLEHYVRFLTTYAKLKTLTIDSYIDSAIDNNIPTDSLERTYKLMYYTQWLYHIVESDETLKTFTRQNQDSQVEKFKIKDKLKFDIAKANIISKLNASMPNLNSMANGSQVSVLVREANKKSRLKPVRLLLQEIGALIQTLKPCFLMSPLSVSTYLDRDSCKFDVVIFDEASQIFPWDAIGAISRATQVIVVGDSKQMPPSNFFTAGVVEDDYDEEYVEDDSLDFESILDISTAILPQTRLNWHYRSKSEELIAFSNANFYDNTLVTFPASKKDAPDMGVDFYYVPNGTFDRKSKTNRLEAERIVELVFEHFDKYPERSLGVVAFSISQQDEIEDLIQEYKEKNSSYEKYFDSTLKEPFFVKNLETVQGDERDTIIFSVAYAKDKEGKFYHNFGPLNKKGGERRLNVAVTRAKQNVKLVASIKSTDINLNRTESTGARLLKEYLAYAEHNILQNATTISKNNDTIPPMVEEIKLYLESSGYTVDTMIGYSGHKIDIGVKHPTLPHYILAIECDGGTYKISKTTRDRDRLREEVLTRLGWGYYRMWSMDWFNNKDTEKKKLLERIDRCIHHLDRVDPVLDTNTSTKSNTNFIVEEEVVKTEIKTLFRKYIHYDTSHIVLPFNEALYRIIRLESPITEELLLEKILPLLRRAKVNDTVKSILRYNLSTMKDKIQKVDDYYKTNENLLDITLRVPKDGDKPRSIPQIPIAELAQGLYVLIQNNVGIKKDGLLLTIANILGFSRIGSNMSARLNKALDTLIQSNKIKCVNGEYFINE